MDIEWSSWPRGQAGTPTIGREGTPEEERTALIRHGYDPDLPPRGIAGPPGTIKGAVELLRNHVCVLDGLEIDGHEGDDLDPGSTRCIHCDYEGPNP